MNYRALCSIAAAAAIAFAQPVAFIAQEVGKAAEIIALARKAIGEKKLDALTTFSVQSSLQRNVGERQINSEVEIVLDLPDKYLRQEAASGAGGTMVFSGNGVTGFNGDRSLQKPGGAVSMGGGMVMRMGGPAGFSTGPTEKPTPEQLEQMNRAMVRTGQIEASRLMLGWFASAHPSAKVQYTYAGEAESPDGKAHVIDVKNADSFTARLFIDQQTHLPLMVTYQAPQPRMLTSGGPMRNVPPGGGHVVTQAAGATEEERKKAQADAEKQIQEMQKQPVVFADYQIYFEEWREAEGIKFPFKMRRAMAGTTTEEWTVNKVKVNPKVDPKRFAGES
jgi:hypothetical protein